MNNLNKLKEFLNESSGLPSSDELAQAYDNYAGKLYKHDKKLAKQVGNAMNKVWLIIEAAERAQK